MNLWSGSGPGGRPWRPRGLLAAAVAIWVPAAPALAQLTLPPVTLPPVTVPAVPLPVAPLPSVTVPGVTLPGLPAVSSLPGSVDLLPLADLPVVNRLPLQQVLSRLPAPPPPLQLVTSLLAPVNLEGWRQRAIEERVRRHPGQVQRDPAGEPIVRDELLAVPSSPAAADGLLSAGFVRVREQVLDGLDERWLVLRPPPGVALPDALAQLRRADPAGHYDYQHIYTPSGGPPGPGAAVPGSRPRGEAAAAGGASLQAGSPAGRPASLRIGLVDAGVDRGHPSLRAAALRLQGCGGQAHPAAHGTAVASLMVGQGERFRGAAPGAELWAADVYCDLPGGGSVQAIAQALAWLVRERVPVINVSLVGPANVLLERAVAATVARGHLVVAAVGNDGPAAPPLYPAAYAQTHAGVVAVTGTDARRRVLPEAGRGPYLVFAAPGSDLAAAHQGDTAFIQVRGTSFAAPLVAGLLAQALPRPDAGAAVQAVSTLAATAVDLGAAGRDPVYGHGLVGESLRVDPAAVRLAGAR